MSTEGPNEYVEPTPPSADQNPEAASAEQYNNVGEHTEGGQDPSGRGRPDNIEQPPASESISHGIPDEGPGYEGDSGRHEALAGIGASETEFELKASEDEPPVESSKGTSESHIESDQDDNIADADPAGEDDQTHGADRTDQEAGEPPDNGSPDDVHSDQDIEDDSFEDPDDNLGGDSADDEGSEGGSDSDNSSYPEGYKDPDDEADEAENWEKAAAAAENVKLIRQAGMAAYGPEGRDIGASEQEFLLDAIESIDPELAESIDPETPVGRTSTITEETGNLQVDTSLEVLSEEVQQKVAEAEQARHPVPIATAAVSIYTPGRNADPETVDTAAAEVIANYRVDVFRDLTADGILNVYPCDPADQAEIVEFLNQFELDIDVITFPDSSAGQSEYTFQRMSSTQLAALNSYIETKTAGQ